MDEQKVIAQAARGELAAFNRLVEEYQGRAYNLAYRLLGDADEASDAAQEAFLSAYRALPGFRGGSFRAWLLRIVTNACYDQLRAKSRHPVDSLEDLAESGERGAWANGRAKSPENHMERWELHRLIQRGIEKLPPEQRTVLVLVDLQGLSYEETAAVTRSSLGTVKSRLNRARTRLRDHLREEGELLPRQYRPHSGSE